MLCLPYYAYVISSTKLVISAEQELPGTQDREGGKTVVGGHGGKMTRKMYVHVNK
jgi:hypothetical protein